MLYFSVNFNYLAFRSAKYVWRYQSCLVDRPPIKSRLYEIKFFLWINEYQYNLYLNDDKFAINYFPRLKSTLIWPLFSKLTVPIMDLIELVLLSCESKPAPFVDWPFKRLWIAFIGLSEAVSPLHDGPFWVFSTVVNNYLRNNHFTGSSVPKFKPTFFLGKMFITDTQ